jgi:hypothetical protein
MSDHHDSCGDLWCGQKRKSMVDEQLRKMEETLALIHTKMKI